MTLKAFNRFLNSVGFRIFSITVVVFSVGTIVLKNLKRILQGQGLEEVITSRGISTNSISILAMFSIVVAVGVFVFISLQLKRKRQKKMKEKKHNKGL